MALSPLIHDGVVALVTIVPLPSSSWRCCPHHNGVVAIIHVVALIAHCQAGVVAVDAEVLWKCVTAAWKALSRVNAKGTGTNDWVIRSLD